MEKLYQKFVFKRDTNERITYKFKLIQKLDSLNYINLHTGYSPKL